MSEYGGEGHYCPYVQAHEAHYATPSLVLSGLAVILITVVTKKARYLPWMGVKYLEVYFLKSTCDLDES